MTAFYTVGHSTRTFDELIELLGAGGVNHVVDVRAMPRSRTNPQFNSEVLAERLASCHIGYTHATALAGLRKRSRSVDAEVNGYWRNASFHNYADYALSAAFREGIDWMLTLGQQHTCAVMCAEAVWWRCHRRIIADHLIHRGATVYHLMNGDRIQPAVMTEAARGTADGGLAYPAVGTASR